MNAFTASDIVIFILGQIVTGAAIWGGIRADIRALHAKAEYAQKTGDEAHKRIDELLLAGPASRPHK